MATLQASNVVVDFGGLRALSGASIVVEPGAITGLIGPNGAGKTTFFNVITGLQEPTDGDVFLVDDAGRRIDLTHKSVHRRARLGIARTFQKLEAFNSLSAFDNVRVGAERFVGPFHRVDEEVHAIMRQVGIDDVAEVTVAALPTGTARLVEVARALATKPKFLLLDEPSSGLNEEETHGLAELLRRLVADGLGVLLVEHDMSFVMGVCEKIFVLDFGEMIASGQPEEIQANRQVQSAYLGTEGAA